MIGTSGVINYHFRTNCSKSTSTSQTSKLTLALLGLDRGSSSHVDVLLLDHVLSGLASGDTFLELFHELVLRI